MPLRYATKVEVPYLESETSYRWLSVRNTLETVVLKTGFSSDSSTP